MKTLLFLLLCKGEFLTPPVSREVSNPLVPKVGVKFTKIPAVLTSPFPNAPSNKEMLATHYKPRIFFPPVLFVVEIFLQFFLQTALRTSPMRFPRFNRDACLELSLI